MTEPTTTIRFTSNATVYVPGYFRWCMATRSNELNEEGRDIAAKMYMLADILPALNGSELKRVAENLLEPVIDEEEATVTFTVEPTVREYHSAALAEDRNKLLAVVERLQAWADTKTSDWFEDLQANNAHQAPNLSDIIHAANVAVSESKGGE